MAPKRGGTAPSSLSPYDALAANNSPQLSPAAPRSSSPSGLAQFFSRPTKWFTRSASASKVPSGAGGASEGYMGAGGPARKHKISRPTDPRPILDGGYAGVGSRSVLDLSLPRPHESIDIPPFHAPSMPSSPISPHYPGSNSNSNSSLGDLRNISRKAWSRSADDLSKVSSGYPSHAHTNNAGFSPRNGGAGAGFTPGNFSPVKASFQERVAEYRNRSDSTTSSSRVPPSPSSAASIPMRHPFPARGGGSPSSSPPNPQHAHELFPATPISISVSAPPGQEERESQPSRTTHHVHTRSHSFTPKLPSKLAQAAAAASPSSSSPSSSASPTPPPPAEFTLSRDAKTSPNIISIPIPQARPRPVKQLSAGEATAVAHRNTTIFNNTTTIPIPIHAAPSHSVPHHTPTPTSTPTIQLPDEELQNEDSNKRSSQILYHSGFLNRLADVPKEKDMASSALALGKGWKPFKVELKGSKMYFYKPPGDRAGGVKELFVGGVVKDEEEEEGEEGAVLGVGGGGGFGDVGGEDGKGKGDMSTFGRKKRAFWGRRTHPDLERDGNGVIERGTFEALVHEAVFGTTFSSSSSLLPPHEDEEAPAEWKAFASTVLLCLPSLVGAQSFEAEFMRCCSYLISGADEGAKEREVGRVRWLEGVYLGYHGDPFDAVLWEEWRRDTIGIGEKEATSPPPPPPVGEGVSLLDALNIKPPPLGYSHNNTRMPWIALAEEGLSRDVLLFLDPHLIAHSLTLFHRSVLEASNNSRNSSSACIAEFLMTSDVKLANDEGFDKPSLAPLFGNESQPHWLTKLLLLQILGADTSSGSGGGASSSQLSSPGRKSEDRNFQTSRTHSRSEVISVWARVGELCRTSGDECSWRAISAALCSRPIARLEKAWKRVDPLAIAAIESWVYPPADASICEPRTTPWGGDVKLRIGEELVKARNGVDESMVHVDPMSRVRRLFEAFREAWEVCPTRAVVKEGEVTEDVLRLVGYWREMAAEGGGTGGVAAKFQRVEQFMSLSLAAEPRRKGLFEPHFWSKVPSSFANQAPLIPLLFPEPLPTITLIDRSQLLRGRVDSDAADLTLMRGGGGDAQMRMEDRRKLQRVNGNQDLIKRSILGQQGTHIFLFNGDLVLVIQPGGFDSSTPNSRPASRAPSRPPSSVVGDSQTGERTLSRTPSIRVKPGSSSGLDRKPSFARRSSLPSISQRPDFTASEPSSEPPLRVVVQSGTLDQLVKILVEGLRNVSVSVADDNGEMSLREGMTRELVVDQAEFSKVWWNVFRSFVTPLVFFELLRKTYIRAQPQGTLPSLADYLHVISSRMEVLQTMKEWITVGGGAQDILDDASLFDAMHAFLHSSSDHMVYKSDTFNDPAVQQMWSNLMQLKSSLISIFVSQTMRPTITRTAIPRPNTTANSARTHHISTREPPDLDRMDPEEFVDNLDGMAYAAFSNVTDEDLYITIDLLEVQSADRTGWFSLRETSSIDELTEIQTIYSHIQEVEPSSMISELNREALYRLLPPGVRSCIRAYSIIRKWLISKIAAPRLGLRARQARIELLLQAIEIARLGNSENSQLPPFHLAENQCVRSFVEAVATSAILSVESRMHHRAWQSVAASRNSQCETLASLLQRPFNRSTTSRDPLTVDMGWLIERMLELIAGPDAIGVSASDGQVLINFDKRRHICNLIDKARSLPSVRRTLQSDEINRRCFERLNNIEKEVLVLQFDHRGIKEEAMREATQPVTSSAKKTIRPFNRLVAFQMEKSRRDRNLRGRLLKEKQQEQARIEKRDDHLNRAMRPRKIPTSPQKQHRNKKSMSSLFNFMRPISSAFGAEIVQAPGLKRTASELDFPATGKPSLVLSILDAQVAQFINNERSFLFKLDTEDGGHYLLQAVNKREMFKWIETISRVTKVAAKRRLTYLGSSPKPRVSDHLHDHPIIPSRDPKAVFGVELEFLLQREARGNDIPAGTVPILIEQCLSEVESRGLTEVGIYRIAGAASEINALKEAYNKGEYPIKETTDIHAVCDLVKSWFRVLPEPVFPSASYYEVMQVMRSDDLETRLSGIRNVVQTLPQANFDLLKRVSEHLDKVTDFEEHNHMTAEALAIVFSPNLLRAPQNDFVMILNNMGNANKLVKALITHFHVIFDEADIEAEAPSDDDDDGELDSPILEEDEEEDGVRPHDQEHYIPLSNTLGTST